jgi:plasmid stability protein
MPARPNEPTWLSRIVVDAIHIDQIREHGGPTGLRDENSLESALTRAQHQWRYEDVTDLADLAAAYGFALARNRPYGDGNTRVDLVAQEHVSGTSALRRTTGHDLAAQQRAALRASIVLATVRPMSTITVRNVPPKVVQALKALARRHNRSMEQEVRDLLEGYVVERRAILDQIEAGWQRQTRRPSAAEVDAWLAVGRP